jgi:hypothetical protein
VFSYFPILNFSATLEVYELPTNTFQHPTTVSFVPEVRSILVGDLIFNSNSFGLNPIVPIAAIEVSSTEE